MANNIKQKLAYQADKVCMEKAKAFDIIKAKILTPDYFNIIVNNCDLTAGEREFLERWLGK